MATIISPNGQRLNTLTTWALASSYVAGDQCIYSNQIYVANGTIAANTPFKVDTTGATWAISYSPGSNIGVSVEQITTGGINSTLFRMSDGSVYGVNGLNWVVPTPGSGYQYNASTQVYQGSSGFKSMSRVVFNDRVLNVQETSKCTWVGISGFTAYALFESGNLWSWGRNDYGQLGLGTVGTPNTTNEYAPRLCKSGVAQNGVIINNTNSSVDRLYMTRVVIKLTDGTYQGCGYNGYYQFGIGTSSTSYSYWVNLPWLTGAHSVWNMGNIYGCIIACKSALLQGYSVWAAGFNEQGNLGDGTYTTISTAKQILNWTGGDSNFQYPIAYVGGGYGYADVNTGNVGSQCWTLIQFTNGNVRTSGNNTWGSIGDGTVTNRNTPYLLTVNSTTTPSVKQISTVGAGVGSSFVLLTDGQLWAWGYNDLGNLGKSAGATTADRTPAQVLTNVKEFVFKDTCAYGGEYFEVNFVRKNDGSYWVAGINTSSNSAYITGAGGVGSTSSTRMTTWTRVRLPKTVDWKCCGQFNQGYGTQWNPIIYDTNGNLWSWGYVDNGRIFGGRTYSAITVPVRVNPNYI